MRYVCMAVRSREPFVQYLTAHIPLLETIYDDAQRGAFYQWLDAVAMVNDTGGIILEDDVILTKDFLAKAHEVIEVHPDVLVQFFSMRKDDETIGSRKDGKFAMNQCVYYPPGLGARLAEYYKTQEDWIAREGIGSYDTMMCKAFREWKYKFWIQVPSLVDHLVLRSEIDKRRSTKRQARVFLDPELSGFPDPSVVLQRGDDVF